MQTIPVLRTNSELNNVHILRKLSKSISTDWFGDRLSESIHFTLLRDPKYLYFYFKSYISTKNQKLHNIGDFKEKLWEKDVAEFFIASPDSNSYQEFNINPDGAWWTGLFSSYRVLDNKYKAKDPSLIKANKEQKSWEVFFSYPIKGLGFVENNNEHLLMNVTSLHYKKECTFISWSTANTKPDYHNREIFCKPEYLCLESEKKKN